MPKAQWLLGDRSYDADWFRGALQAKGIQAAGPATTSLVRQAPLTRHSRIRIMFGGLKDWRRVTTRYDRCPTAISFAATVIFGCDRRVITLTAPAMIMSFIM